MTWKHYRQVKLDPETLPPVKPRYSLTGDILGFRRCRRQYGFFAVRKYVPSRAVQLFYGTLVHEVLDRVHKHYEGLEDPATTRKIPTDDELDIYFDEAERALKAKNIRVFDTRQARKVLKRFNRIEGPELYPRVIDTEHRVQGDRDTHIVEGVIDVLVDEKTKSRDPSQVEIWDYKAARFPSKNPHDLANYRYQMLVYAALYKIKNGCYPKRAVLYFMNELAPDSVKSRPKKALYSIDLKESEIQRALREFDKTALAIQKCKDRNQWNPPKQDEMPMLEDTCAPCDIRWSCSSFVKRARTRGNVPQVPRP
jgi:putative RecB family exonuclease